MSNWSTFLSRDEVLGGLPARHASTVLAAIEHRTAHLTVRSRQAMTIFLHEKSAEARERAFLDAMAQGRALPIRPTIQDLERNADEWAPLVPTDPAVRAAVARMIGDKYVVPHAAVPSLRRALGLNAADVADHFERLYGRPLASIHVARPPWRERLRWATMRVRRHLERLSPFWTAFALTLIGTVGTSTLALPIAAAEVGPFAGLAVLLVLGLVNILTIAAMSEAVSRNGGMHDGGAGLGRLVADYLGGTGVAIFTVVTLFTCGISLLVRFIGLATTMTTSFGLPMAAWPALLLLVNLFFLSRGSIDSSVASTLLIGGVTVGLIVLLSVLALPNLRASNLGYHDTPIVGNGSFDRVGVGLIVGVTLSVLTRQVSVASTAKVVLRRDPSGRSLLWGTIAAVAAAVVLHGLWIVAVNGAVAADTLTAQSGTALEPLAAVGGSASRRLGNLYATLALGLGSIYVSVILVQYVRDLVPDPGRLPSATAATQSAFVRFVRRSVARSSGPRGRSLVGLTPIVLIFLIAEWLLLTGRGSFTKSIAFVNAITGPLIVGVFPMLLLVASRHRGEYVPATVLRFLGRPLVVGAVYLISLTSIFAHGLIIWDNPAQRAVGLATGTVMVCANVAFVRRGSFRPRTVADARRSTPV